MTKREYNKLIKMIDEVENQLIFLHGDRDKAEDKANWELADKFNEWAVKAERKLQRIVDELVF
jgi:hypothetical protein